MTTYYIEDHLLSARVRAFIKDEDGHPVFLLIGSWGVKGDSLSVEDLNGNLLAKVVQTSFSPNPRFDLYEKGKKVGSLKRMFSLKRDYYWVSRLNWIAIGETRYKRYQINSLGKALFYTGIIKKEGKSLLKMTIPDETQAPLCICVTAVLDYWVRKSTRIEELSMNKNRMLQPLVNKCKNVKD